MLKRMSQSPTKEEEPETNGKAKKTAYGKGTEKKVSGNGSKKKVSTNESLSKQSSNVAK
jgi:hypothetical protein